MSETPSSSPPRSLTLTWRRHPHSLLPALDARHLLSQPWE